MELSIVRSTEAGAVWWARKEIILFKEILNRVWKHRKDRRNWFTEPNPQKLQSTIKQTCC